MCETEFTFCLYTLLGFNPGFTIQGKVHHFISPPLPTEGNSPQFSQIYFYDPEQQIEHRKSHPSNRDLNDEYLKKAQKILHEVKDLKPGVI